MRSVRNLFVRAFLKAAFTLSPCGPARADIGDDFIKWLCFANAGMLDKGNLYLIDQAMRQIPSMAPIVEIGSFCGLSANVLTHYKRRYGLQNALITCDKWDFENNDKDRVHVGNSPVTFSDYKTFVRDSYIRNIRMFSGDDLPFTVEMTANDFFSAWREKGATQDVLGRRLQLGGSISFCYIDGAHSYEGVKQDFLNCDALLEKGGFILFDDSTVEIFGVRKLMPEVLATDRYELIAQNPNHLFRKLSA
ncbi:MAG: class I SAM-dependent methyltransferase [Candidatus Acidiferrales bacterium]